MDDVLNIILKSDEAAKQKIAGAEEYRKEQLSSLQSRKEEIAKNEVKKAVNDAVRISERRKSAGDRQLDQIRKMNADAQKKMEDIYKKNEEIWVDQIFKNVIEG